MKVIICGSVAYDNIMVFPDYFKDHILPDKVHILNVSFMVPSMRREFGGCAGNIAYNLNYSERMPPCRWGQWARILNCTGEWMDKNGIDRAACEGNR